MNKKRPLLLFFENLVEPIQTAKTELGLIEKELTLVNREFLRNSVFAYVFSLFESSLSDCLKRFLKELPSKLPTQDIALKGHKEKLINGTFSYKILESWIDEYVMKISYGTITSFLVKFCELLSVDNVSIDFSDSLNEKKQRRNLLLHNNLVINNKYIENTNEGADAKGRKLEISQEYLVATITEVKEMLSVMELRLSDKYSEFTKAKVIRDIWNYLFDSPILRFEDHWHIKDNEIAGFKCQTAEKWSCNYSSGERTLLVLFLQNFNPGVIDNFFKFDDLRPFVCTDSEKVAYIVEVFAKYPLLLQNNAKRNWES